MSLSERVIIKLQRNMGFYDTEFEALIGIRNSLTRTLAVAEPIVFKEQDPARTVPYRSILQLTSQSVQELMNDLWAMGIRPTEMKHTSETIDAMKSHIDDFRKIVFSTLNVK